MRLEPGVTINDRPSTYSVKAIANWILDYAAEKRQSISNMSLNKLVFFAYEHALTRYGRKLTEAKIEAWEHGPVFREIYSAFRKFGSKSITSKATRYNLVTGVVEIVSPGLALDDEQIMIEALEPLIALPAYILREISHDDRGAWAEVWNHQSPSNPGMEITDDIILAKGRKASRFQ